MELSELYTLQRSPIVAHTSYRVPLYRGINSLREHDALGGLGSSLRARGILCYINLSISHQGTSC